MIIGYAATEHARTCYSSSLACSSTLETWVERVAQTVAKEREPHHHERDGNRRNDRQEPEGLDQREELADHAAPTWRGRADADTNEAETRLGEDGLRNTESQRDDDRRHRIWQHVFGDEPEVTDAGGSRSQHIVSLAH